MNKKFWILLATSAVLATTVATGCAAQKQQTVPATATTAIETTAEATESPAEQIIKDDFDVAEKIAENEADAENFNAPETEAAPGKTAQNPGKKATKKTAYKTTKKTTKSTSKKTAKKSTVDNERLLIVKAARAEAEKNAAKYKNMNEKIAEAKRVSAQKVAAQRNADARKNMNKAAEDAQNAAKEAAGKKAAQQKAQKAAGRTAAEKTAAAKKAAAKKAAESKAANEKKIAARRAFEKKIQAKRDAEKKRAEKKRAEKKAAHQKQIAKRRMSVKKNIEHFKKLMGIGKRNQKKTVRIIMFR